MEKSLVTFSFDTLSKIARKTRFCRTYTSVMVYKSFLIDHHFCISSGAFAYRKTTYRPTHYRKSLQKRDFVVHTHIVATKKIFARKSPISSGFFRV